jgi:hypothetical protein
MISCGGAVTVYSLYLPTSGLGMTVGTFPQHWLGPAPVFCVKKVLYICNYIYVEIYVILGGPVPCTFYSYLIFPIYVFEKMLIYREKNGS